MLDAPVLWFFAGAFLGGFLGTAARDVCGYLHWRLRPRYRFRIIDKCPRCGGDMNGAYGACDRCRRGGTLYGDET
jgi:hypothetical protein